MPINRILKVLIVDDSASFREALKNALDSDSGVEVVGGADSAREAEKKIRELSPDVVTLDAELPDAQGMDFVKQLIHEHPVPVVLVGALNLGMFEALDAGAVDFVHKPTASDGSEFQMFCNELLVKIKIASTARVKKAAAKTEPALLPALRPDASGEHIIAVGASTGGTEATLDVLRRLPPDTPGILIVQHMPVGFTKMYAERLNRICSFSVLEAQDGFRVKRGQALIAAGDQHMTLAKDARGYYVKCAPGEKVSGHCPSADVLFRSVAQTAGSDAIGVILTGMGRDGAQGLLEMRRRGAFTIGQDKASCVVYGMPMAAYELGAVVKQAPGPSIARLIIQRLNATHE